MPTHTFISKVKLGLCHALNYAGGLDAAASLGQGQKLIIGLSGGADSVALLAALMELSAPMDFAFSACHINHQLRGKESDQDEEFCRQLAQKWGFEITVCQTNNKEQDQSEAELRHSRYQLLRQVAQNHNSNYILVAHNQDDQVETFLFRLLRGTSPTGLTGIKPARKLADDLLLLRPMLNVSRKDCLQFLKDIGQQWREDSSNGCLDYTRNYIRHRLLPIASERFGNIQQHLEQLRLIITDEDSLLNKMTMAAASELSVAGNKDIWWQDKLLGQPKAIARRLLTYALSSRDIEANFARIEKILQLNGQVVRRISLNEIWDVEVKGKYLIFIDKSKAQAKTNLLNLQQSLKLPGLTILPALGKAIKIESWNETKNPSSENLASAKLAFPSATDWQALVDLTAVELPLTARIRKDTDQIQPFGMNESVKLKKYLHNHKSPLSVTTKANQLIVIADQKEVIWVPGVGLSNKVRVKTCPSHKISFLKLAADDIPIC